MKKLFIILALSLFIFESFTQSKNKTSLTLSATPLDKNENDDLSFGGAYFLADSLIEDEYTSVGGKIYYRLSDAKSTDEEKQNLDVKRAYVKVRPFASDIFEIAIGKLYNYYLPGAFFSLTETYTGSCRWGKTGVAAKSEIKGFTLGAALPVEESKKAFKENWGLAGSISYDFSTLSKEVPLTIGANVLYEAREDGNSDVNKVSEEDFSECIALNFSKRNFSFFSSLGIFMAYSHNAKPYISNTSLSPLTNKSNQYLKKTDLFSFALRPVIHEVKITSESEIGRSTEGDMIPFHTALQIQFPVYGVISLKPMAGYYAAWDENDSSNSFDCWELYPRIIFEFEKFTLTAGWDAFYKEIADSEYRWLWCFPISAKLTIGK